ncbi:MAG: hypothetical protein E7678_02685, partial [Ruminococcaceae bacterium]|nr:hypothetical protein [Oscillospiraceae bacterium]
MNFKKRMLAGILCLFIIGLQILTMASCGKSKECSHHFGKWFKTKSATCAEEGFQSRRCEHCGEIETSTLEKLEHEWVESTCTAQKTCKNCSAVEGEAKPHSFTVETVKPETLKSVATCTSAAIYYKSCSCGLVSTNPEDVFTNGSALGHIDANKDHICETCSAAVSECVDANKDHDCDYGCTKTFGEHADGDDADHLCDYGCNKNADEGCYDTVVDGKCDECGAEIGHVCIDDNKDHNCDICTKTLSQHTDSPKDHICDYCGSELGKCEDANKNHICDYGCDKTFGEHDDGEDTDHLCDYGCKQIADSGCYDFVVDGKCDECGEEIEHDCLDENTDHSCDICSATMGDHVDRNFDHVCEYGCNTPIGVCEDGNFDHRCDYGCSRIFGTHADSNTDNDHLCDYGCGAKLEESCVDAEGDGNHSCDLCGNVDITLHTFGEATCSAPATCSECGATTGNTLEHLDANFDHICDYGCGKNDMGVHADSNNDGDHVCDYGCKAVLEGCSDTDTDNDHKCDICDADNVTQHIYNTTVIAATCDDAAKNIYTCNCGHSYEEIVGVSLGHDVKGVEKQVDGCEYVMEYI